MAFFKGFVRAAVEMGGVLLSEIGQLRVSGTFHRTSRVPSHDLVCTSDLGIPLLEKGPDGYAF